MTKENLLLARLPTSVRERLDPQLERVELAKGQVLIEPGLPLRYLYFPLSGLVSLIGITQEGGAVELTTVANEGVIGLAGLSRTSDAPHQATVRIGGTSLRLRTEGLDAALRTNVELREALFVYAHQLLEEISQAVVCQCFHELLPRLCRWLLTAADRLETESLDLTHETLAQALGVIRSAVTEAALELQDAKAIRSRYGRIVIADRALMARSACECYRRPQLAPPRAAPAPPLESGRRPLISPDTRPLASPERRLSR